MKDRGLHRLAWRMGPRGVALTGLAVVTTLWACAGEGPAPRRLTSATEVAERAAARAARRAPPEKPCARFPLRAPALDGPSTDALIALAEGADLSGCVTAARAHLEVVERGSFVQAAAPAPLLAIPLSTPLEPQAQAALAALASACAPLAPALARAAAHKEACSPYGGGRRALPTFAAFTWLGRAHVMLARQLAAKQPVQAVEQLLDLVLVGQDLGRGGAPWGAILAGTRLMPAIVLTLGAILASDRLPPADARRLGGEVETLLASEIEPRAALRGERDYLDAQLLSAGGDGADGPVPLSSDARTGRGLYTFVSGEDAATLAMATVDLALTPLLGICTEAPSQGDCIKRGVFLSRERLQLGRVAQERLLSLDGAGVTRLASEHPAELRLLLQDAVASDLLAQQLVHLGQLMSRAALLAGVRVHLGWLARTTPPRRLPKHEEIAALPEAADPLAAGPLDTVLVLREFQVRTTAPLPLVLDRETSYRVQLLEAPPPAAPAERAP